MIQFLRFKKNSSYIFYLVSSKQRVFNTQMLMFLPIIAAQFMEKNCPFHDSEEEIFILYSLKPTYRDKALVDKDNVNQNTVLYVNKL